MLFLYLKEKFSWVNNVEAVKFQSPVLFETLKLVKEKNNSYLINSDK